MKKLFVCLFLLGTIFTTKEMKAQASERNVNVKGASSKPSWPVNTALLKGSTVISFFTSGQGFGTTQPNTFYLDYTFNPKCNFFVVDKLSLGLGYLGMKTTSTEFPNFNAYSHNIEAEINYYFHSRPHSFMMLQVGYVYGQPKSSLLQSFPGTMQTHTGSAVKIGAAITRRLKCNEFFGLTFNPALYFDASNVTPFINTFYSQFNVGVSFFLPPCSKKS